MVESNVIRIRVKPEVENALRKIQQFAGFLDLSKTVRHLIDTGLAFYRERDKKITNIREDIYIFTIRPNEIYPDIRLKRSYGAK